MKMKRHKGRTANIPKLGIKLFGNYSIISKEHARIKTDQLASVVMSLKRSLPTGTSIIERIKPSIAVTAKPLEVRMGKGKGPISHLIARIRPNSVLVEIATTDPSFDITPLKAVISKIPVRT